MTVAVAVPARGGGTDDAELAAPARADRAVLERARALLGALPGGSDRQGGCA